MQPRFRSRSAAMIPIPESGASTEKVLSVTICYTLKMINYGGGPLLMSSGPKQEHVGLSGHSDTQL